MSQLTINLTETQTKALEYVAFDPQEWVTNFINDRSRVAVEEITHICIQKCLETNTQIPGSKDEMVSLAFEQGWVKTAAERQAEIDEQRAQRNSAE